MQRELTVVTVQTKAVTLPKKCPKCGHGIETMADVKAERLCLQFDRYDTNGDIVDYESGDTIYTTAYGYAHCEHVFEDGRL